MLYLAKKIREIKSTSQKKLGVALDEIYRENIEKFVPEAKQELNVDSGEQPGHYPSYVDPLTIASLIIEETEDKEEPEDILIKQEDGVKKEATD